MDFEFASRDLVRLYEDASFTGGFSQAIVRSFRKKMQSIAAAVDERDLRAIGSLHFEKLAGNYAGFYSIRLNDQFRLILKIVESNAGKTIRIIEIVDYH